MTIQYNARLELDGLADTLAARGLSPGGKVQKFIDSEVIRLCDPKVPFRTGVLKHSPMIASVIGHGLVIYATPYARYSQRHLLCVRAVPALPVLPHRAAIWVDAEISVAPDRGQRHHNPNSNRTAMVVAEANTMVSQFSLKKPRILFTSL